jgi:hypothetical protein
MENENSVSRRKTVCKIDFARFLSVFAEAVSPRLINDSIHVAAEERRAKSTEAIVPKYWNY